MQESQTWWEKYSPYKITQKAYQEKKKSLSDQEDAGSKFPWMMIDLNILKQNVSTPLNPGSELFFIFPKSKEGPILSPLSFLVESIFCLNWQWIRLNRNPRSPTSNVTRTRKIHVWKKWIIMKEYFTFTLSLCARGSDFNRLTTKVARGPSSTFILLASVNVAVTKVACEHLALIHLSFKRCLVPLESRTYTYEGWEWIQDCKWSTPLCWSSGSEGGGVEEVRIGEIHHGLSRSCGTKEKKGGQAQSVGLWTKHKVTILFRVYDISFLA